MVAQVKAVEVKVPAAVEVPQSMTAAWFDQAVQRSFEKDITVKGDGSGRYLMSSSRDSKLVYTVTAHGCQCEGFRTHHRCYHVCRAAFEDSFSGPEPSAPAALPDQDAFTVVTHITGRAVRYTVQHIARRDGVTRIVDETAYPDRASAESAARRLRIRRQRGPVHAVDCPVCHGWGCDRHGIACRQCHGKGETMQPVPSVAELIAAGRWPGQPSMVEKAA